ncbi:hypothetical protein Shyhy01_38610 [Streptomyces hygroscopicus subsp. hygroscopicus]|uniref:phosphopantetheine-binding protein n=1 Tax=Streptomyces sp. KHY 26 TaxID=3097359 RepID=UPI0024A1F7A5|nr:phosphopantetheine-binding protein [Streptomyces hygroscopicus]GLX50911.1 hypothetical protein Shyhy01_38610 [Streptomyces hygroscopicus subsp. hygroscopicus]
MAECREDFVDNEYTAPVGRLEETVAGIVAEVLGVDRIGRSDSFYDFGGTSLQAIRICARIESKLGIKAMPLWLFDNDVLEDFVGQLAGAGE